MPQTLEIPLDLDLPAVDVLVADIPLATLREKYADQPQPPMPVDALVDAVAGDVLAEAVDGTTVTAEPATNCEPVTSDPEPAPTLPIAGERAMESYIADCDFQRRVRAAADYLAEVALSLNAAELIHKREKKRYKLAIEELSALTTEGPEEMPLFDRAGTGADKPAAASATATSEPNTSAGGISGTVAAAPAPADDDSLFDKPDPDAWRRVPLADLGLRPTLTELLVGAGLDTIGRLEDRRAEVYSGREKWPKGVGKAKVTEIEDALLAWLGRNREGGTPGEQIAGPCTYCGSPDHWRPDCPQIPIDIAKEKAAAPTDVPTPPASDADIAAANKRIQADAEAIAARAEELDDGSPDCFDPRLPGDDSRWQAGSISYSHGVPLTACPLPPGDERDDWLRGWMSAENQK